MNTSIKRKMITLTDRKDQYALRRNTNRRNSMMSISTIII